MIYKGWRIIGVIDMPRAFNIKNTRENGHIDYGKEIQWQPLLRPGDFTPRYFMADKDDESLSSRSIKNLKQQIDDRIN